MTAIGVFDSGLGGLTVVSALERRLPEESIVYLGDTARLPYGTKSPQTIIRYSQRNIDFLVDQGVKGVVVACNTASALALPYLKASVPLWGVVEPGARAAASVSREKVAVLATESTIRSGAYQRAIQDITASLEITAVACPLFVPLVEEGWLEDPITVQVAQRYLNPILSQGLETVLLGCTHYPLLRHTLRGVVGAHTTIVDSAEVTADAVAEDLEKRGQLAAKKEAADRYFVTDAGDRFALQAQSFLGKEIPLTWIDASIGR